MLAACAVFLKWEARPEGQTCGAVAGGCRSRDRGRQEAGPARGLGKVQEAEQAFTGRAQHHGQHKGEARGKQCELGCWPVGPALLRDRACQKPRASEGEGALEDHVAQTSTNDKYGCFLTVLQCEHLGDGSSSEGLGLFLGSSELWVSSGVLTLSRKEVWI